MVNAANQGVSFTSPLAETAPGVFGPDAIDAFRGP
jgi:hypothetical protein